MNSDTRSYAEVVSGRKTTPRSSANYDYQAYQIEEEEEAIILAINNSLREQKVSCYSNCVLDRRSTKLLMISTFP